MSANDVSYKIMRLILLFDMPVQTDDEKREYRHFRESVMDDGFMMMQFSVYVRYCENDSDAEKHIIRVKKMKPKYGNIRILKITENQYTSMIMIQGEKTQQEEAITSEQLFFI